MCRYLALSCLLLCVAVWYAHGASTWGRDMTNFEDKAAMIKEFLKECVTNGKLSMSDAKKIHNEITSMDKDASWGSDDNDDNDMWGDKDASDDHEWGDKMIAKKEDKTCCLAGTGPVPCRIGTVLAECVFSNLHHLGMNEYLSAMKHVKKLFKQAKSTGKELTDKLHHVLYYYKNNEDPLIDLDHKNTLHVSARFVAEEMRTDICGVWYTLPAVDMKTKFNGDIVGAADLRTGPEVWITDNNGDNVHDGLYTMIGSLRGGHNPTLGNFWTPMLLFMFVNIPGSAVNKGDVVVPYIGSPYDKLANIFLYKQDERIHNDFAIADYTSWDECKFQFRCQFQQEKFVKRYDLDLKFVGQISIVPDPYSVHFIRYGVDLMNKRDACEFFLLAVLPEAFKLYHVDVHDERMLDKAANTYASHYVTQESFTEKETMDGMKKQLGAVMKHYLTEQPYDSLVSYMDDIHLTLAFRFKAPPSKVDLCGQKFGLKAVEREVYFKDAWEGEPVELLASEIREAPDVKILNKDHKMVKADKYYTLMIVDRSEDNYYLGEHMKQISDNYQPFINWMVVNIKGGDVKNGYHLKPYMPYPESKEQYVFLYEQPGELSYDFPISDYTVGENRELCWPQDRCRVKQTDMAYDYGLKLVAVARYNIKLDIYGALFLSRWGRTTPDTDCSLYLKKDFKLPSEDEEM